ncbi:MAG: PASTA domain-containing protein [Salibacteraceae bacterium]
MFKFIFSKVFIFQAAIALVLVIIAIGGSYIYLKHYTKQENTINVPSLIGYDLFEAESFLKESNLLAEVVDSLYLPEHRGGEIVEQEPRPDSKVKEHRKIYLTISRYNAPMVRLPNILNQTLALALAKLDSYGIKVSELINKPSDCTNCVVGVELNGKTIEPGASIERGVSINLIIGEGATGDKFPIPALYGLSAEEAQALLLMEGFNVGATPYVDCETKEDSSIARVYKQNPEPNGKNSLTKGSSIDLYLSPDKSKIPPINIDSLKSRLR